jgi:hypothetical protein
MGLLESGMLLFWPFIVVILIVGLLSFFTVQTAQVAVITRFGKFLRVAEPGLNWKWPFIDRVAGRVSLRVNQITLTMETKDNVFVTIPISVQNRVRPEKVYDAFYKLSDPMQQIQAYVEQVILGHVPGMTLDEVFASQSGIAAAVKQELDADMAGFGYEIVNVLVTDIVPDAKVKSAMSCRARASPTSARPCRRVHGGCDAACDDHAVFRHDQIDRRNGQDQHAVPVALTDGGARHFRTDHAVDAGRRPGEELARSRWPVLRSFPRRRESS